MLTLVVFVIALALIFDFLNGMNDAANSIATIVGTRVLRPGWAVAWAAFFNFVAFFGFGTAVAKTIGKGIVAPDQITPMVVLVALVGANIWVHSCTRLGLPISVSHSLVGGLAGAAIAKTGSADVLVSKGLIKIATFIVLSPLIGMLLGFTLMIAVFWIFRRWTPRRVDRIFAGGQLASSAAFSIAHGSNDAQNTMGIITLVLFSAGYLSDFHVPFWVGLVSYTTIAIGTLAGGWRVIRTMGMRLTALKPAGGFSAETAGAISIIGATVGGIPVSTTHTIAGAIVGVGSTVRISAVRWGVAGRMVFAWILTIPCAGLIGAAAWWLLSALGLAEIGQAAGR